MMLCKCALPLKVMKMYNTRLPLQTLWRVVSTCSVRVELCVLYSSSCISPFRGLSSAHDEAGPIFIDRRLSTVDRLSYCRLGRPRLTSPLLTSRQDIPSLYPMTEFAWLGREFVICLNMTNDVETITTNVIPHISAVIVGFGELF